MSDDGATGETLREALAHLEAAYAAAHAELAREAQAFCGTPEQMRDANGRFILLDALTAIVQARTALAQTERT